MSRSRVVYFAIAALPFCFSIFTATQQSSNKTLQGADSASPSTEEFEVATIKPHPAGDLTITMGGVPGKFTATNATVKLLIEHAFGVPADQISGGPSWLESDHFDINAKIPDARWQEISKLHPEEKNEAIQRMVQSLLKERFQLAISHHAKEMTVYALVVAKGGAKLRAAGSPRPSQPPMHGVFVMGMTQNDAPVGALAAFLSGYLGRTVLDRTGLPGRYDISFYVVHPEDNTRDASDSAVFTSLEDQLGLKLVSRKEVVDTIVIDHLEQPSEN